MKRNNLVQRFTKTHDSFYTFYIAYNWKFYMKELNVQKVLLRDL